MVQILSILSSLMILIVFWIYYKQIKSGASTPNPSSWAIWTLVMVINALTYQEVIISNPIKGLLTYVVAGCIVLLFIYSMRKGKFTKPDTLGIGIFLVSVAIGIYWQTTGNAFNSQIALQVILLISFIPTIVGLLQGKAKEKALPWIIGFSSYIVSIIAILWEWNGNYIELAFPIVNGVIGNGIVGVIALKQSFNFSSLKS